MYTLVPKLTLYKALFTKIFFPFNIKFIFNRITNTA